VTHGLTLYCDMSRDTFALAEQRVRELRALTEEEARAAIAALLDLGASLPIPPEREKTSGLVTQQALFHRKRPPA